jgi:hypothetical protein
LGCWCQEETPYGEVGGVDKAKRVWWLGLYRYIINESMFIIRMDNEAGEKRK